MRIYFLTLVLFCSNFTFAQVSTKTEHITDFIKAQNGRKQIAHGPNCFATALAATDVIDFHGHVEGTEFGYWMRSPLCRELSTEEEPKYGDIVAISEGSEEVHAFVYVSETLVFQKAYLQLDATPELALIAQALMPYTTDSLEILRTNNKEQVWAGIYECESLDNYISENYPQVFKTRTLKNIYFLQQDLAKWSFQDLPSLGEINSAQGQIQNLRGKLMKETLRRQQISWPEQQEIEPLPDWLIYGLLLRLQSMDKQLNFLFLHARDELNKKASQ